MTIRIMLADDHRMFREAIRGPIEAVPEFSIVAEAGTGRQTLEGAEAYIPDVLLLDIALPDMSGVEVARQVTAWDLGVHIVALSGYSDRMFVEEMLKAGAQAYVLKSSGSEELLAAIRAVMAGQTFLSPEVTSGLLRYTRSGDSTPPPLTVLGKREQEVLRLLAGGMRSHDIGVELGISTATVDVHRRNIKQKLGLRTTAELTRYAIREGLRAIG